MSTAAVTSIVVPSTAAVTTIAVPSIAALMAAAPDDHLPQNRAATMILPQVRDPRMITLRRGGTLTDAHHHLLALWAAECAERVLPLFEAQAPGDLRPREAVDAARRWARGELPMMQARALGGHAMGAARPLAGAPRFAAYAAGQAAAVGHVAEHDLGAAAYAIRAVMANAPDDPGAARRERDWQRGRLPGEVRELVLDDQERRDGICWGVFAR